MTWSTEQMAIQVEKLLRPKSIVNLGIGLPTKVAAYIDSQKMITIHSENGVLGVGGPPAKHEVSPSLINAGKETITIQKNASFFDSSLSFGMIRGGHVDTCILGGMEVDIHGNLANWWVPGKKLTGMGGAMDLVNGAKEVIVMMNHFDKNNNSKLVRQCQLPLTGARVVSTIVTEYGIFYPRGDHFLVEKWANEPIHDELFRITI